MDTHRFDPADFALPERPDLQLELLTPERTRALGAALGRLLQAGDFLALIGDLGAGKTTLVQGLAAAIDPTAEAVSPTYTLLNIYEGLPPIYHIDLYRLASVDDLESMGYWDYVASGDGILCVEWLDRIPEAWPGEGVVVHLRTRNPHRIASIWASPSHDRIVEGLPGDNATSHVDPS